MQHGTSLCKDAIFKLTDSLSFAITHGDKQIRVIGLADRITKY